MCLGIVGFVRLVFANKRVGQYQEHVAGLRNYIAERAQRKYHGRD